MFNFTPSTNLPKSAHQSANQHSRQQIPSIHGWADLSKFLVPLVKCSMTAGVVSLIVSTVFVSEPSHAQVINGSFENGFTGYNRIGDTSIETSSFGIPPNQGNSQALITNDGSFLSVPASNIEDFLELAPGTLDTLGNTGALSGADEGSAIQTSTTFTATTPFVVTVDFNFLTQGPLPAEPDFNDFSFLTISNSRDFIFELADTFNATTPFPNSSTFNRQTGYQTRSFTIPNPGTYALGFGVTDVGDPSIDSGLLVDNIRITAIPEPSSILGLLTFCAFGARAMLKRFRGKCKNKCG